MSTAFNDGSMCARINESAGQVVIRLKFDS